MGEKNQWLQEIETQLTELKQKEEALVAKQRYLEQWENNLSILENNATRPELKRFKSYDVNVWNENRVVEWLRTLDLDKEFLPRLCSAVQRNHINGERLLLVTQQDLERLGLASVGYQVGGCLPGTNSI